MQFLRWFPLLLLFLSLGIPYAQADNQVVRVGVYENEPKVFTSEAGRPSGIFIDIIEFIAKREGWNLKYVPGTWAEGLDRLAKGEIDLMPDVAYTSDREKIYSFLRDSGIVSMVSGVCPQRQQYPIDIGFEWKAYCSIREHNSNGNFYPALK